MCGTNSIVVKSNVAALKLGKNGLSTHFVLTDAGKMAEHHTPVKEAMHLDGKQIVDVRYENDSVIWEGGQPNWLTVAMLNSAERLAKKAADAVEKYGPGYAKKIAKINADFQKGKLSKTEYKAARLSAMPKSLANVGAIPEKVS